MGQATLKHLIRRLRQLRAVHGLSQEAFSELAGISYKYYQAVEAGRKRELRLTTLERLARAYRIEVHQLLAPKIARHKTGPKALRELTPLLEKGQTTIPVGQRFCVIFRLATPWASGKIHGSYQLRKPMNTNGSQKGFHFWLRG